MILVGVVTIILPFGIVTYVSPKFIDDEKVLESVDNCRKLYASSGKIETLSNQSSTLSDLEDDTDLCFVRCVYQMSGFIDDHGQLRSNFVERQIRKLTQYSETDSKTDVEEKLIRISEDITFVCSNFTTDSRKSCLRGIRSVECLEAIVYLYNFGYLNPNDEDLLHFTPFSLEIYRAAIMRFQIFFSLSATGKLDSNCLRIMNSARCGIRDIESPTLRQKRYNLYRVKWNSQNLTYKITKYSKKVNKNVTDDEISRAFSAWTNVTTLHIEKSENPKADITIRFEKRAHGDRAPFDGPGQTLAHTFYPLPIERNRMNSLIHFDNSEKWTVRSKDGINLYQIAVHEIGHSLGLRHSNVKNSVMWPQDQGYKANFTLHKDDIDAIQALYGVANHNTSTIL